ncbi:addiction module toxin RelE [Escherichia coli]|nr:addiction module toxin RelE [Escherichia coli]
MFCKPGKRNAPGNLYTKSFKLHQGGKRANPDELTQVSDSGERTQPRQRRLEG